MSCRHKDHHNYQRLAHTWTVSGKKENFFVSYAVRGPMVVPNYGLRQDLPVNQHEGILTEFSNFDKNPQWKVSRWDKFLQHEAKAGKSD